VPGTVPAHVTNFRPSDDDDGDDCSKTTVVFAGVATSNIDSRPHASVLLLLDDDISSFDKNNSGVSIRHPTKTTDLAKAAVTSNLVMPFNKTEPHAKTASKSVRVCRVIVSGDESSRKDNR
jgi:hypothetical protein